MKRIVAGETAYAVIRQALAEGRFLPDQRLFEDELAAMAGVSRTPVREALRRLDAEGFVHAIPNRGVYVASWSEEQLDVLLQVRLRVEGYGVRLAAMRMSPEEVDSLESINQHMRDLTVGAASIDRDDLVEQMTRLNNDFHERVLLSCGDRLVEDLATRLVKLSLVRRAFEHYSQEDLERSLYHHAELLAAIRARDADWAESITQSHLFSARAVLRQRHPGITR
jgi:DNA-binding GntR family transcriptional regulator